MNTIRELFRVVASRGVSIAIVVYIGTGADVEVSTITQIVEASY